ncbi:MAG: YqgE/AlgH family protein [Rhodospirillales bacterium]|nr:YqgE/AlgH family protein [Rhodospirillales bacterium]HJO72502.1 YqgE/AlgH family protein [Rhodospirillales bacterium]
MLRAITIVAAATVLTLSGSAATSDADHPRAAGDMSRYLGGQLLVATRRMGDPRFAETVIYMVQHDAGGAMGLVVNRVMGSGPLAKFLKGVGIEAAGIEGKIRLHYGGPVEIGRGFALHSRDFHGDGTVRLPGDVSMSALLEVLKAAAGEGPERALFLFGYAGWAPGQLENELKRQDWVTAPVDIELIFDGDEETKWHRALSRAGLKL